MKKILSTIAALALCGLMLTACGGTETADTTSETTTVAEETAAEEASDESAEETEAASEETEAAADNAEAAGSAYADLKEFAAADFTAFEGEDVAVADSNIGALVGSLEGATSLYFDVADVNSESSAMMAITTEKVAIKSNDPSTGSVSMIYTDSKMYIVDDANKSCYFSEIDDEAMEAYDIESALSGINFNGNFAEGAVVKASTVEIGGEQYTLEVITDKNAGYLFNSEGTLAAMMTTSSGEAVTMSVNAFTSEVPDEIFEIPSDYTVIDMAAALAE